MHSPLKDPRTRYPGQSLSEQIRDISEDQSSELVVPFMLVPVVAFAWTQQFWPNLIKPWMITLIAVAASTWSIRRIVVLHKQKAKLRKGLIGEQILGKFLEEQLMPHKYQVIHDLVCKADGRTFNIDHVVVGPTGVFSIETKYWKKPAGPDHRIFYDGKKILVDGHAPDNDPLIEAIAGAKSVQAILEIRTGKRFDVKPIVVFLGWYTTRNPGSAPAWVLNEQAVPTFIKNDFRELSHDDGLLAIAQLKQYSAECGKD
ncbi:MAG: hypothetical protein A2X35_09155 [Elusimicrobia bacterium GWA2_61_42]|nr:MAG: hypothetical protein A2X35_09155 [Elusimicrobia bacterium GWA2_61_42]